MKLNITKEPLIFTGRKRLNNSNYRVLEDIDATKRVLHDSLETTNLLVILDLYAFPYEILDDVHWNIPIIALIPEDEDFQFLCATFGEVLFSKITFFDYVVMSKLWLWDRLRNRYGWGECQRLEIDEGNDEITAIEGLLKKLDYESMEKFQYSQEYKSDNYWEARGERYAGDLPHLAVCSVHHDLADNKSMHRIQYNIVSKQVRQYVEDLNKLQQISAIEIGCGVGRWACLCLENNFDYTGYDVSGSMVASARRNFPKYKFEKIGRVPKLSAETESINIAFSITVLHHNDNATRERLLSELFRTLVNGGIMVLLEDFVAAKRTDKSTVYPMSISEFTAMVQKVSSGQVVLDWMETFRYDHFDQYRTALLVFRKVSIPGRS